MKNFFVIHFITLLFIIVMLLIYTIYTPPFAIVFALSAGVFGIFNLYIIIYNWHVLKKDGTNGFPLPVRFYYIILIITNFVYTIAIYKSKHYVIIFYQVIVIFILTIHCGILMVKEKN